MRLLRAPEDTPVEVFDGFTEEMVEQLFTVGHAAIHEAITEEEAEAGAASIQDKKEELLNAPTDSKFDIDRYLIFSPKGRPVHEAMLRLAVLLHKR